jgi:hypothetical protein
MGRGGRERETGIIILKELFQQNLIQKVFVLSCLHALSPGTTSPSVSVCT